MTSDEILGLLLFSAIEDDAGLWEMRWELNTQEPEVAVDQRNAHALWAVRELIRCGWATLSWALEPFGELRPIPPGEIERVLGDQASWEPVAFGEYAVRISATSEGEAHHFEGGSDPGSGC